ncbi:MAG: MarR family transcriptional regulator [Chloroflexota bacterium]
MNINEEIRYLILAIQREGNRNFSEALRPLDLTPAQAEVIRILSEIQPTTLLNLGEHLVCESGSPSRLINRMVKNGLVEKQPSPDDGRAILLSLTAQGEDALQHLDVIETALHSAIEATIAESGLSSKEIANTLWQFVRDTESGNALQRRKNHTQTP